MLKHFIPKNINIFNSFVFHQIGKTFTLYTSHIQNVGISYSFLRKICMFHIFYIVLFTI